MDIISEEAQNDPVEISEESAVAISVAIEEIATSRANARVDSMANSVLKDIENLSRGCTGATPEEMLQDIIKMIVFPVLKGDSPQVPEWLLAAERRDMLQSAQQFTGNSRERFVPLPYGIAKLSDYRLSKFMEDYGVSVVNEPSRDDPDNSWVASVSSGPDGRPMDARGHKPTSAVNNLFTALKLKEQGEI